MQALEDFSLKSIEVSAAKTHLCFGTRKGAVKEERVPVIRAFAFIEAGSGLDLAHRANCTNALFTV